VGQEWSGALIGDSGASGGKPVDVEPFGWLDSGSIGVGAGSGDSVSSTGALGVVWSSIEIFYR